MILLEREEGKIMANVLCLYEEYIATVAGTEKFLKELSEYDGRVVVKSVSISKLKYSDFIWCDVLFMIRPNNLHFAKLAKKAQRIGITVVFFLDDDLMNLPKEYPDMPWRKRGLADSAENSDIIVSSNLRICKIYGEKYKISRKVVAETPVSVKDIINHDNKKNQRIKIVYAAGLAHKVLFDKYIKPILGDLDKKLGDKVSITFMGVHPEINPIEYNMPIIFIEPLPFDEYRKKIEQENFDIGLAPLDCTDFSKCKYYNKFIEYAMFGIVGIYSNTEPYTFVIKNKYNGILTGDKPENWLESICEAVENRTLLDNCRSSSYNLLNTRFNSVTIMDRIIRDIPELIREHTCKKTSGNFLFLVKITFYVCVVGDYLFKALFYLKRDGVTGLLRGIDRRNNTVKTERRAERNKQMRC